jgi:hypothetical protein
MVTKMSAMWNTWAHKANVLPAPWTESKDTFIKSDTFKNDGK